MNRHNITTVLADLDDVIARLRDAGARVTGLERERIALEPPPDRNSYPPGNGETRRTASEHFAKAREYTSEALRRLRRDQ